MEKTKHRSLLVGLRGVRVSTRRLLSLLLVLLAAAADASAQEDVPAFLEASFDPTAMHKALIPPIANAFIPNVVEKINGLLDDVLQVEASAGDCCELGEVGAQVSAGISDFAFSPAGDDYLSVQAEPHTTDPQSRFLLNVGATGMKLAATVGTSIGVAALIPIQCTVGVRSELVLPSLSMLFDIGFDGAGQEFKLGLFDLQQGDIQLNLEPVMQDDACSLVSAFVVEAFNIVQNLLLDLIVEPIGNAILNVVEDQISTLIQFQLLPNFPNLELFSGRSLGLAPRISTMAVSAAGGAITTKFTLGLSSQLDKPAYRAGRSHHAEAAELAAAANPLPPRSPDDLTQVLFRVSAGGANAIMEVVWYLVWSFLSTDEPDNNSILCTGSSTTTDPCPFPPVRRSVAMFSGNIFQADAWLMFFLGLVSFQGIFTKFNYQLQVLPPQLVVDTDSFAGKGRLAVVIEGEGGLFSSSKKELLAMEADASAGMLLPRFDPVSGTISNVGVKVDVGEPEIGGGGLLGLLLNLLKGTMSRLLNGVVDSFTDMANGAIAGALPTLPKLKIPGIENFPVTGKLLQFGIPDTGLTGVPAAGAFTSFFELKANLVAEILDMVSGIGQGEAGNTAEESTQKKDTTFTGNNNGADVAAGKAKEWALLSNNLNAMFTTNLQSAQGQEEQECYRIASDGDGTKKSPALEKLSAGEWVPVHEP